MAGEHRSEGERPALYHVAIDGQLDEFYREALRLGGSDGELSLHGRLVETCILRPWPGNIRELVLAAQLYCPERSLCRISEPHGYPPAYDGATHSARPC